VTFPPMTTSFVATDRGFDIVVEHDEAQSYSRAVDPKAMRAAREAMRQHRIVTQVALVDVDYGGDPDDRRCRAVYHFVREGQ
jgi:hypothetical protein